MTDRIVIINRGSRTFQLKDGPGGEKRFLPPGGSIETLDDSEAKQYLNYGREIVDAAKVVPANADKVAALHAEISRLQTENKKLADQLIEMSAPAKAEVVETAKKVVEAVSSKASAKRAK